MEIDELIKFKEKLLESKITSCDITKLEVIKDGKWSIFIDTKNKKTINNPKTADIPFRISYKHKPKKEKIIENNIDPLDFPPEINYNTFRPSKILISPRKDINLKEKNNNFIGDLPIQKSNEPFKRRLPFPNKFSTYLYHEKQIKEKEKEKPLIYKIKNLKDNRTLFEKSIKIQKKKPIWPPIEI